MIMKNRCFELFKSRENPNKVADILIHTDYKITCMMLWDMCPKGVYGVLRDLRDIYR